jgi:tetratricopeptide (TPR) repeat protein
MSLKLDTDEWSSIVRNHEVLASSSLGGTYVQKDVFKVLCYLCVYDGLYERSIELTQEGDHEGALLSLRKSMRLLSWPTAIYAFGLCCEKLGKKEEAMKHYNMVIQHYHERRILLSSVIPISTPSRDNLIELTEERLDRSGALLLGHSDIEELIRNAKEKVVGSA